MSGRPVKHSLTLRGHRTSVSLEALFWQEFRRIARARNQPINALAAEIDAARGDVGLASAIRVFVLQDLLARQAGDKQA
ncbi:MAG: aryl-sulfate sulfotransferase [Rhodobacteraceae bacterium]|nr:MAG: aryl-sulfate sulfotransferase [Paracoccaceae bacterium]